MDRYLTLEPDPVAPKDRQRLLKLLRRGLLTEHEYSAGFICPTCLQEIDQQREEFG